jgi:alkylation response protein AidB-like acyl-CoA dehydrogenase
MEAYPFDNVTALKAAGFMGYTVPKVYGGRGGSCFEATLIIEEMARVCGPPAGLLSKPIWAQYRQSCSMAPKSRSA